MDVIYTAEALSTGAGRNGHVRTTSGHVDTEMAIPKEMGGSGNGANPEELFAAGYAACFHSAIQSVARTQKIALTDSTVGSRVHVIPNGEGGFVLAVDLEVVLPEIDPEVAQALVDAAHQVCPYSNATRGNIVVNITVSDD
ncbi:organic hydroperoxide resistance protein [Glaciihabitans sp. dw_435]|uniref:organic hydroperoxide resistance protein n=1 Tax=Glaciihabitans sp. dw_435 TaxID=2720081 RepID=UPI001BD390B6|nr:organic hydroperoxide resistance protein [Glaciihabitans sp. dw_435]